MSAMAPSSFFRESKSALSRTSAICFKTSSSPDWSPTTRLWRSTKVGASVML